MKWLHNMAKEVGSEAAESAVETAKIKVEPVVIFGLALVASYLVVKGNSPKHIPQSVTIVTNNIYINK